jgi:hypothetical protein
VVAQGLGPDSGDPEVEPDWPAVASGVGESFAQAWGEPPPPPPGYGVGTATPDWYLPDTTPGRLEQIDRLRRVLWALLQAHLANL